MSRKKNEVVKLSLYVGEQETFIASTPLVRIITADSKSLCLFQFMALIV